MICHEKISLVTDRFDAFVEVRPAAAKGIKNHQRVRVHLGTAERLGKIVILGSAEKIEAKQSTYCQVTLSEPLPALRRDHFILRDETARRTLAGGLVINPLAERHKRGESDLRDRLEALHHGDLAQLTEAFVDGSKDFALSVEAILQFLNVREEQLRDVIDKVNQLRPMGAEGERVYTSEKKWQRLKEQVLKTLEAFHGDHPLVPGMDMEELRGKLVYELSPKTFRIVVDMLFDDKLIAREENLVRLTRHRVQLGGQEKTLMDKIKKILGEQPLAPPDLKDIERQAGVPRNRLNEVIRLLERDGSVVRVTTDMYFLATSIEGLRQTLKKYLGEKGEMTAASFRDLIGSSRKYTIPLLEYFDRDGLTIRIGDIRRLKSAPTGEKTTSTR